MHNENRPSKPKKFHLNNSLSVGLNIHPLYEALLRIARFLNVDTNSADLCANSAEEPTVLEASKKLRLRVRQVRLQGDWWKEDGGAFLAFLGNEEEPVSLIPRSPGSYVLYRAGEQKCTLVNQSLAARINSLAYSFYVPFESNLITSRQLLNFCFKSFWKQDLGFTLLTGVMGGVLTLTVPLMTGLIFDHIIPAQQYDQLLWVILLLVLSAFASFVFQVVRSFALLRIEGKLDMGLESALWDRILQLPSEFFREYSSGDLANRAAGITRIRKAVSGFAVNTILAVFFSIFNLVFIFSYSTTAGLCVLASMVFLLGVVAAFIHVLKFPVKQKMLKSGRLEGLLVQLIRGYHKFIVTGSQNIAYKLWNKPFSEVKKLEAEISSQSGRLGVIISVFPILSAAVFYWMVFHGKTQISTGGFMAMFAAFSSIMASLVAIAQALGSLLQVLPSFERMKPIFETLPEVDDNKSSPGNLSGKISLSHVFFRYPGSSRNVIDDFNLSLHAGEMVALVGESGSGKSTLLRLLLGFEKPLSGAIFYDGMDLAGLDVQEVRSRIGTVIQNAKLMSDSIYKNIIGASNLSMNDAWDAAKLVSLDKDIAEMPMGMHTYLNEGGRTLSGGQKQRILLARALVRKPMILFLDEATSSLDNNTQAAVMESINQLKITRVVIAHRLSTIMHADRIIVLDHGRIVQQGTYHEMLTCPGQFQELAKRQMI